MLRWETAGIRILFDTKAPGGRRAPDTSSYSVCLWHRISQRTQTQHAAQHATQHTTQRQPGEHNHSSSSSSSALSDSESESSTIGSSLAYRRSQRTGDATVKRVTYIVALDIENLSQSLVQPFQLIHQQHANLYTPLAER
jgi:hypothetical protein